MTTIQQGTVRNEECLENRDQKPDLCVNEPLPVVSEDS